MTILLLATGVGLAQPPAVPSPLPKQKVLFALKTDAGFTEANLRGLLKQVKEYVKEEGLGVSWADDPVRPVAIDEARYQFLERLVTGGLAAMAAGQEETRDAKVESVAGRVWKIDLGDPLRELVEISFLAADGTPAADPAPQGDKRLQFVTLGQWKFAHTFATPPKEYVIKYKQSVEGKDVVKTERKPWPVTADGYWLVELSDFVGQPAALFKALEEGTFAVPVKQIIGRESTTLVLGDLSQDSTPPGSAMTENTFVFRFPLVYQRDKVAVEKMYVLFPLIKEQAEKKAKELRAKDGEDVIAQVLSETPVLAGDPAKLSPKDPARWYEVPAAIGKYERGITLDDPEGWRQAAATDPRNYRVTVYQLAQKKPAPGAPARKPVARLVGHPDRPGDGTMAAIDQEEKAWLPGLRGLKAKPLTPLPEKK